MWATNRDTLAGMNRQALLGVWILIGIALIAAVAAVGDSNDSIDDSDSLEASAFEDGGESASTTVTGPTTTEAPATTAPTTAPPTTIAPDEQPLPTDAAGLAEALTEAERMVRSSEEAAPWGRRQQQLYRVLTANREWATEVLDTVGDDVRLAVENNWDARLNLSALVSSGPLSEVLPAWRIRAPLPAAELLAIYEEAEAQTSIPWEYLAAINLVETRMGRIEGLSTAGATGPMQFLPSTFAECCEGDPTDDRDAIIGAGVYLTLRGGPDDMAQALRGYNNSSRYVSAVTAYANVLEEDPAAYYGYHAWDVYFLSAAGLIRMPVGYDEAEAVPAADWIAANPDALIN